MIWLVARGVEVFCLLGAGFYFGYGIGWFRGRYVADDKEQQP